jgi:hypothetical protein
MKRFTDAGRAAINAGNLYAGLTIALTMPDVCASLEDPGPGKSKARFIRWTDKWAVPRFTSFVGPNKTKHVFLDAEDLYQLRCSLIHSGSSEIVADKRRAIRKAEFFDDSTGNHMNQINDFLQLQASDFSRELFAAADEWDAAVACDEAIQRKKKKLLKIHTAGAVIQGIRFG